MVSFSPALTGVSKIFYSNQGSSAKQTRIDISFKKEVSTFLSEARGITGTNLETQNSLARFNQLPEDLKGKLVYNGRPISDLSPQEASDLISEDGHFGVKKTSQRISGFVINAAGDDLEKLKAGREGVLRGFKAAEEAWGDALPRISYDTLEKTLAAIDDRINALGGSVVDLTA